MNKCYSSNDCSDNEKCISDGYEKKCTPNTTQPPKPEPGYLPTIPPKDTSPEQNTDAWKEASEQILVLLLGPQKTKNCGRRRGGRGAPTTAARALWPRLRHPQKS